MKLLDIYSYLLASWINSGGFSRQGRLKSTDIQTEYNAIFTKTSVKQIFRVTGIKPVNVDVDFISYLHDRMFEMNPDVELDVNVVCHPVNISVSDEKFTRAFTKASDAYSTYKEAFDSQKGIARLTGKTYRLPNGGRLRLSRERLDDYYQLYMSYRELFERISAGDTVCLVNIFIEIVGKDLKAVRRASNDIYGLLGAMSIGVQQLKNINKAYYLEMGPAVGNPRTLNKKFLPQLLFTEENIGAFSPYKSRGLVGGGKNALLFGMDFRSRLPLAIDLFKDAGAQVFVIAGKTGSGKTYSAFQIALSCLAAGIHVSALDVKGNEWIRLTGISGTDAKIITFDAKHPSFVNTLRLDDVDGLDMKPTELFTNAVNGTTQLFMLVLNLQPGEGNPSDGELVLREAVMKMYSMKHVDPANPASFKFTARMRYSDVLPILESLGTTATYTEEQKHMVKLARSRLHSFFGESGLFSEMFRHEITLSDIINSKLVIYELSKNSSGSLTDSLDLIRIFMITYLDGKKRAYLRSQEKFLAAFYEELQRVENFGNLLEYICGEVTGSRSNNTLLFLLLNSFKVLQGKSGQDIRSNITSLICGSVEDNDVEYLREDFGRPWLAGQLELMRSKPNIYRHTFACEVDTGVEVLQTVYKVEFPAEVSRRFRTRTILED